MRGEELGVKSLDAGDGHSVHERDAEHGGLGAGNAPGLREQHIGGAHIDRDLIRKRHGHDAAPLITGFYRGAQLLIAPRQDAEQGVFIRDAQDRIAERDRVAAADAAGHDEIYLLILRQAEHGAGVCLAERQRELARDGHTGGEEPAGRQTGVDTGFAHLVMREEVPVKLRLREERDAGIVREDAVAADGEALMAAQEGQRLHRKQVGADDGIIAVLRNECAELPRVAEVREVHRGGDTGRAVHLTGVVHHAEHLRRAGGDAVEELIEAERAGIAEHMQHIEKGRLVPGGVQRLLDGKRAVVVPLTGRAAEKKYFHAEALLTVSANIIYELQNKGKAR